MSLGRCLLTLPLLCFVLSPFPRHAVGFDFSQHGQHRQGQQQTGTANRAVFLTQVQALTLHRGRMTTGRRSSPVPQLKCIRGCEYEPDVVQCTNVGSDGTDVQWKCEADLPSNLRFSFTTVSCEGFDYPEDPRVLEGSCGLEYSLGIASDSSRHRRYRGGEAQAFSFGAFVKWGVIVYILYMAVRLCWAQGGSGSRQRGGPRRDGWGGGGGWWWPPSPPPPPPPPPPRYDYKPSASEAGPSPWLTGAAGLGLGYWFGRRSTAQTRPGTWYQAPPGGHWGRGESWGRSDSHDGGSSRQATAYASTSRR